MGLRAFGGAADDWERLSFIGQTYGAVSALIAVLALVGVAVTLVYQARDARRMADEARRQAMNELLRMAMDDADLDECWGPVPVGEDVRYRKQQLYTNMIITQWGTAFRAGTMPEKRLRANAVEMFTGPVGRAYWAAARTSRLSTGGSRSEHRFHRILEEAYQETAGTAVATASAPGGARGEPRTRSTAVTGPIEAGASGTRRGGALRGRLFLAFAAGAVLAGSVTAAVLGREGDRRVRFR